MKNIKWISRHVMTNEQLADLKRVYGENIVITQLDETIKDVTTVVDDITDVYAVVMPPEMVAQLFAITDKPIVMAKSERVRTPETINGEAHFQFVHAGWFLYEEIVIRTRQL